MVSYETVRRWVNHFGAMIAAHLRKRRPKPHAIWHLDEVYLKIDGRMVYLWRAVDAEGEVLDVLVQAKRNKHAALKLMRELLKNPSPAEARLLATETELISCRLEGSGRYISGGSNPVKERGPWAVAHLRVVTPLRRSRSGS